MSKSRDLGEFPAAALDIDASGNVSVTGDVSLADNDKIILGDDSDLQIYHDGLHSYVTDAGTGDLRLSANNIRIQNADNSTNYIKANNGSDVELFYNNAVKLATTDTGIDVTGTVTAEKLVSANGILELDDNGTHNGIINSPASLYINIDSDAGSAGEDFIIGKDRTSTTGGTELFRVQEDGNFGIGTNNPATKLHITKDGNQSAVLDAYEAQQVSHNTIAYTRWVQNASGIANIMGVDSSAGILGTSSNHPLSIRTNNTTAMTIGSTGNVGIGTISPSDKLTLSNGQMRMSDNYGIRWGDASAGIYGSGADENLRLVTSGSEKMRLDSSGNLLVGTTSESDWETASGFRTRSSGSTTITRSAAPVLYANRVTSHGAIQEFLIDGTTVGNIGSSANDLTIYSTAAGHNGLRMHANGILPTDNTGAIIDADADLGISTYRFKDLHLSGTAYVGGNVGIGTSSPQAELHIMDSLGSPQIKIDNQGTSTNIASLLFQSGGAGNPTSIIQSGGTASGNQGIIFKHGNNGAETERMRIDSSGNLLVGTTTASLPLTVGDRSGAALNYINGTANTVSTDSGIFVSKTTTNDSGVGYGLQLANNANNIGARSPMIGFSALSASNSYQHLYAGINGIKTGTGSDTNWNRGAIQFSIGGGSGLYEKMRLDPNGNLLVGTTTTTDMGTVNRGLLLRTDGGGGAYMQIADLGTSGKALMYFQNGNGVVGTIVTSGSSTSYNTSSDYRLKEDDIAMTGSTERVKALRPINFAWKADGSRVDGFFAHELQEIVPEAATGTKDAMKDEEYEVTPAVYEDVTIPAVEAALDEDGVVITEAVEESTESVLVTEAVMGTRSVPDYQGIDQSKLVPLLTATIQELIARIEILEAK